jgi:hypothetical protein
MEFSVKIQGDESPKLTCRIIISEYLDLSKNKTIFLHKKGPANTAGNRSK